MSRAFQQLRAVRFATGTVTVDDIESVLGRLSLRVGTNFTHGGIAWQPFFTASVFHEFAGDVYTTHRRWRAATTAIAFSTALRLSTSPPAASGPMASSASERRPPSSTPGGSATPASTTSTGEDIEGWNFNAGLRYQFTPEHRAGGMKDGPVPAVYAYNWTGPYIGASVGALVWGHEDWRFTSNNATVEDLGFAGALVGGQVGYNAAGRPDRGTASRPTTAGPMPMAAPPARTPIFFTCEVEMDGIGSVTGRVGYAMGRALFYGKGGVAFGDVTLQTRHNAGLALRPPTRRSTAAARRSLATRLVAAWSSP